MSDERDGGEAFRTEHVGRPLEAAQKLARRLGLGRIRTTLLHHSQHVCVRLASLDIVARIAPAAKNSIQQRLAREISVVGHLARKGAPVVPPVDAPTCEGCASASSAWKTPICLANARRPRCISII